MSNKLTDQELMALRVKNSVRAKRVHDALKNTGWEAAYQFSLATSLIGAGIYNLSDNYTALAAGAIGLVGSKLGPAISCFVEKMKITSDSNYYHEKVKELGTLYAQKRLELSQLNTPETSAKSQVRKLIAQACHSKGFEIDSKFYKDCINVGAQIIAATKVDNPAYNAKAAQLLV